MTHTTRNRILLAAAGLALFGIGFAAFGQGQRTHTRAEFMRMKLEFSKKLLEGLTLEDYDAITSSAKALGRLSEAAEWEVPTIPNAPDYILYTGEFQRLAREIGQKSREKNIDGATLAYLRLTMNCVNCHKYVRQSKK
jgi:hypothetical protein